MSRITNPMHCQKRQQLAGQLAIAARVYSEAVVALTRNHTPLSRNEYNRLREAAEEAGRRSEARRIAYEEHVQLHRCVFAGDSEHSCRMSDQSEKEGIPGIIAPAAIGPEAS